MSNKSSLAVPPRENGVTGIGISDLAAFSGSSSGSSASSVSSGFGTSQANQKLAKSHDGTTANAVLPGNTSTGSDGQVWMGAFERIMGDQDEHYQAKARSKHMSRSPDPSNGNQTAENALSNSVAKAPSASGAVTANAVPFASSKLPQIRISPGFVDFGTANVGARKSAKFSVENVSELPAKIEFRFVSKVLSMDHDEVEIQPHCSTEVRIDFFPRRVNHTYRKQVTVANMLNRDNDQILEIRSQNVDEQKIGFHSLFYRILTSTGSNFVDFGDVNINCTRLRSFGIENVSKAPLSIELTPAQTEDLKLFVKAEQDGESETSRRSSQYVKHSAHEDSLSTTSVEAEPSKVNKAKLTAHLKERFLESMNQESPATIRNENTTWRTAQKQRHFAKSGQSKGEKVEKRMALGSGTTGTAAGPHNEQPPKRVNINLVAALKKGGKGRITMRYGKCTTFKDRSLLRDFEYLDLATGPPVDERRVSVKSKMHQHLEAQETGKDKAGSRGRQTPDGLAKKSGAGKLTNGIAPSSGSSKDMTVKPKSVGTARDGHTSEGSKRAPSRPVPALTGKRKVAPLLYDALDVSKLSLDELITAVEAQDCNLSTVFMGNARAEEQSVRTEINLQRELNSAINEGRLIPFETISLEPGEEKQVLAIYSPNGSTRPHIMGNARKQDSRIFIRIVDFSTDGLVFTPDLQSILELDKEELPIRELMVKSNLCRSLMELSQPHINFGHMHKGETKERKIVIQNRSEWALRYCIRKSGMIASGDIKIKSSDRYGVVPGYGKREVEFVFCPSLTGNFQERLVIENVADRDKDEVILIKANVARLPNFSVEPRDVSFANAEDGDAAGDMTTASAYGDSSGHGSTVRIGQLTRDPCSFVVSNISAKPRVFVLHIDDDDLLFSGLAIDALMSLSRQEGDTRPTLSKAEEEEVETISQKLKIANRKGQAEKIQKYQTRLVELGMQAPPTSSDQQQSSSAQEKSSEGKDDREQSSQDGQDSTLAAPAEIEAPNGGQTLVVPPTSSSLLKRQSSAVTLSIAPQQSKRLLVRLRPRLREAEHGIGHHSHFSAPLDVAIPVQIHELKNIDEVQIVEMRARIMPAAECDGIAADNSSIEAMLEQHQMSTTEEGMILFSPASKKHPASSANQSADIVAVANADSQASDESLSHTITAEASD